MKPHLAQVLNTLAHEIRTPLAVSQGYLKLFLDGRLTDADDTRRAMEQTRQALGALSTYCLDMGKISALAEGNDNAGIPERVTTADLIARLRGHADLADTTWNGDAGAGAIDARPARDVVDAIAIVLKSAFDEAKGQPQDVRTDVASSLTLLAGHADALSALQTGPAGPASRALNFGKGGKGLKLIWAAFVLDRHGVETWTIQDHKSSVGIRIPLVTA
jgi:signal transduction histidine kinase